MRNFIIQVVVLCISIDVCAQDFYSRELSNLSDISRLGLYRTGEMHQLSSYDRTGGNDDGFSGKYSAVREESGGLVMADLEGPGVVNRIWTPTPTRDTVKFYFDGEKQARIAIPFIDLFTGKQFPFLAPLSGNEVGGYYCYLPIPYERSLKIVYTGKLLRFHQTQYRSLSTRDNVQSFTADMVRTHQKEIDAVSATWSRKQSPLQRYGSALRSRKVAVTLRPGEEHSLFGMQRGGRIVGMELDAGSLVNAYHKIRLTARWDNETVKSIDLPLHDFFGFAFGKPAMRSILLGSDMLHLYSYLPMPFDRSAEVSLAYTEGNDNQHDISVTGTIFYTEEKRNSAQEGKFYAQYQTQYNIPSGTSHTIADVTGKGHYVGTMLVTQGLEAGSTWYFEGDDRATIDGNLRLHGTGSEDYFNGGWYAVIDRWDRRMSLPIHGCLEYDMMTSRTGGYRFYLSDKLNFEKSFQLSIEHQPDAGNNVRTEYTSIGFFYADNARFNNKPASALNESEKISRRHKLTPQGMVYSLYWLGAADYQDPSIVFSMKKSDQWFAHIDPEAVPIAQIFLDKLDNGRYKVYLEYEMTPDSGPFSLWQRSKQISEWLSEKQKPAKGEAIHSGEIEITDELKTLTIRKKSGDTAVRIFSVQFEPLDRK